jgi:adenylosuccinate synthase
VSGRIQIIQGGQTGSEAKGSIAAHLALRDKVDFAVRTGATNAGHSVVYGGEKVALQQLPVGFVNESATLVLGAGALVDLDILQREIELLSRLTGTDIRSRLFVDSRAYIHRHEHKARSAGSDRHYMIGATGKGCSEALIDRIRLRGLEDWTIGHWRDTDERLRGINVIDTELMLNRAYDQGALIQLEGTQGQLLDLYLGPYPYTTHKQTGPAQWLLEAGLSPNLNTEIVMVIRTYPIRVAGNSGPLPLETSWPTLGRQINAKRAYHKLDPIVSEAAIAQFERAVRDVTNSRIYPVPASATGLDQHVWTVSDRAMYRAALSEINKAAIASLPPETVTDLRALFELTTVTKKLRRVSELDAAGLATAARQIRPTWVALTFLNYVWPQHWYTSDPLTSDERLYVASVSSVCAAPVRLANRGPASAHIIDVR